MLVFIWSQKHGSAIVANVDSIHDEPCVPQLGLFHLSLNSRRSNVDNPGKSQIFWQAMPNKVSSLGGANARVRMSKIWRQWKILCSYRASSEEVDVDEIHVIQCSLKDSLLQRSGQIHGPLEYSVQSWHVHLVGKSVQDWPREKIEDKLHLLKYLESTNL